MGIEVGESHSNFPIETRSNMAGSSISAATEQDPTRVELEELSIPSSLQHLQTDEQRLVLDTVAQVRKCGLDAILSLPQIVVCGDQSSGKSSTLEALTEIPFPRNDNLCTRFATEISLRQGPVNSLTIKIIPDDARPSKEKRCIGDFVQSITDFAELPRVMDLAMQSMGISTNDGAQDSGPARAFARDILSIEIEGPSRPQLTLVDVPGLIHTSTKGVSDADVALVSEITDRYISQSRTICLAVVSAANDAANQSILAKVRKHDPRGERTLGIITKPDIPPAGSGSEAKFLELARNEDVFFKLGWHVVRNRKYEEGDCSLMERDLAETRFFRTSNFKSLPKECVGIDALRTRLSVLLFEHVKRELPKLRQDLEDALGEACDEREALGSARSDAAQCRAYLTRLSMQYYDLCKAGVNGHYEDEFFHYSSDKDFSPFSNDAIVRFRAVVQHLNTKFARVVRLLGHKYRIDTNEHRTGEDKTGGDKTAESTSEDDTDEDKSEADDSSDDNSKMEADDSLDDNSKTAKESDSSGPPHPVKLSRKEALAWVRKVLVRSRGKELSGNFNPLLIGELFWEQSGGWKQLAVDHIEQVSGACERFVRKVLTDKAPKDVQSSLWSSKIADALKDRRQAAYAVLEQLMQDTKEFPLTYNHYYTDTIANRRQERYQDTFDDVLKKATDVVRLPPSNSLLAGRTVVNNDRLKKSLSAKADPDMEKFSCEDALDCLFAIYKDQQKVFVANVTVQVIERHMIRGLEHIFSPIVANAMSDAEVKGIAAEPSSSRNLRAFLNDRIKKLEDGRETFRAMLKGAAK